MSVAVERYISNDQIEVMKRLADAYFNSGYFADTKSMAQAFVKISAGAEMGLLPFEAMTGIDVIEGKPTPNSGLLSSKVKEHARYDYRVQELTADRCLIVFYENGVELGESEFTQADADAARLTGPTRKGEPSMYTKYPRNMLFARAMSNGVSWFCPDVTRSRTYDAHQLAEHDRGPVAAGVPAGQVGAPDFTPPPADDPDEVIEDAEIVPDEPAEPAGAAPGSANPAEAEPPTAEQAAPAASPAEDGDIPAHDGGMQGRRARPARRERRRS
jgi:hypothetical protein